MDFLIESLKNFDFWGSLYIDLQTTINIAEQRFGVMIKKTSREFWEWCEYYYQNNPCFDLNNLDYEYKLFVTEQLTSVIQQQYPNIGVSLKESYDGCDRFSLYGSSGEDGNILDELRKDLLRM